MDFGFLQRGKIGTLDRWERSVTTHAREVLADCERLLAAITQDLPSELWRPRWAGLVALLRAVGHVLDKVDGEKNPRLRRAVDSAWKKLSATRPEPRIFWEFIEAERNNVLKAYAIGAGVNTTVTPGAAGINRKTGEVGSYPSSPTTFNGFMRSGFFRGRDPIKLCEEAIGFWRSYLDRIDAELS